MSVVHLVEYRSRETLKVLEALTEMARKGEVIGIAMCFRTPDQEEHMAFTGPYKASPGKAVNAAMRLGWRLTQMQDEILEAP